MLKVLSSKISWLARVPLWIGTAVFAACAAALFYMVLLCMLIICRTALSDRRTQQQPPRRAIFPGWNLSPVRDRKPRQSRCRILLPHSADCTWQVNRAYPFHPGE
jgi:hypothetical protein